LEWGQSNLDFKTQQIADMDNEIVDLDALIQKTCNSEGYQRIENIVKENVNAILTDKKAIISMALASVIEAIKSSNADNKDQLFLQKEQKQVSTLGYFDTSSFNNNDISTIITPTVRERSCYYYPQHLSFSIEKLHKIGEYYSLSSDEDNKKTTYTKGYYNYAISYNDAIFSLRNNIVWY
jgi:hypothetical protein